MFIVIAIMFLMTVLASGMIWEKYENWDFDRLPSACLERHGRRRRLMEEEEDMIPRFGGVPNQSQVWSLGSSGGCGCAKYLH